MPGGFTSGGGRDGYQNVDEEPQTQTPRGPTSQSRPPPGALPVAGAHPPAAGAYQSV